MADLYSASPVIMYFSEEIEVKNGLLLVAIVVKRIPIATP